MNDPDLSLFEGELREVTLTWTVFCLSEGEQVGEAFASGDEATSEAETHNQATGHTAVLAASPQVGTESTEPEPPDQLLKAPFCILFDGRPKGTIILAAPSPEIGLATARQYVALLNEAAPRLGFPPLFTAALGACEVS